MNSKKLATLAGAMALVVAAGSSGAAPVADRGANRELPASISTLKLKTPLASREIEISRLHESLRAAKGEQRVIVRLRNPAVAQLGLTGSAAAQAKINLRNEQANLLDRIRALDPNARVVASTQVVLNAVFVEVDAAVLPKIAVDKDVMRVAPVGNYQLDLSETVPYIGAETVQGKGVTGRGIKVAVLDSGIDYTHRNLGGPGTLEAYEAAYGTSTDDPRNTTRDGLFPTAKVIDGYDFVGEVWPNGPEAPDPDPIDFEGHGTHVADIIGGRSVDGLHKGVAPGASLLAVKVCSAVSSSCSGIALIQGMEFAVNPNGDGRLNDRVDVINMSLGSPYGQPFDDDLSAAVDNATMVGVLTVASAGNSADKPFANGTPGGAISALSVAQTAVPSGFLPLLQLNGTSYPAVFQPWSVLPTAPVEGPLQYANGAGGNLDGCAAFAPGSLAGKAVIVNRGGCNFTLKAKNVGDAGGVMAIIGLIAPGDPFEGGDGGDRPITIPSYMVSQAIATTFKGQVGQTLRVDPAIGIPLAGSMVGSSSRGPQHEDTHLIKPEIGAPGASVSAIAGSGDGTGPFGGTSGAAPMVAGAAALLLEATGGTKATAKGTPNGLAVGHGLRPVEVKARLMNNAFTDVENNVLTGELAPITRIGGGEVRVDQAIAAPAAAWDNDVPQGALSFGFVDVADDVVTITRTVRVRNYSNKLINYAVKPSFRFANDEANGAVSVSAPSTVNVGPGRGSDTLFDVSITIDGSLLRGNFMNSGSAGADPTTLTTNEYDGYLVLDDGKHPIHLPWHVLPRKAARVTPSTAELIEGSFPQAIGLNNNGVGTAQNDAYALLATSPKLTVGGRGEQSPTPDIRAVGINTFPVPAGFCSANPSFIWAFAVNTWGRQQHLLLVSHQVELDTDRDGAVDYVVLNRDFSGPTTITDGRQLSWVLNVATGGLSAFFFAEHSTNTGNTVLLICGEQIGMGAADLLSTQVNMNVFAQDFYFGGPGDLVEGLTVTPLGERWLGVPEDVAGGSTGNLDVYDFGAFPGNSPELGLMLITNGDRGAGNRGGATKDTEALLLLAD